LDILSVDLLEQFGNRVNHYYTFVGMTNVLVALDCSRNKNFPVWKVLSKPIHLLNLDDWRVSPDFIDHWQDYKQHLSSKVLFFYFINFSSFTN
jgi:hypothetical protein